jgi:hypothetical protein
MMVDSRLLPRTPACWGITYEGELPMLFNKSGSMLNSATVQLARRRVVSLGAGRLHEELTFVDNDHHSL